MQELNIPPEKLFGTSDDVKIFINGIETKVIHMSDEHGDFLAIWATDPALYDICGDIVLGKSIYDIEYLKYQGRIAVIKAYYH
jgi:hypothetical protein